MRFIALLSLLGVAACGGKAHTADASVEDGGAPAHDARPPTGCIAGAPCSGPCGAGTIACVGERPRCSGMIARAGTVCRASTGPCDYEEMCDGSTIECPDDFIAPPGEPCGPFFDDYCDDRGRCVDGSCIDGARCDTGDPCVVGETRCDGPSGGRCVVVGLHPPGTPCSALGSCDELGACIEPCAVREGTPCSTVNPCEHGVIACVAGIATCVDVSPATAGVVCRSDAGECDVAEVCDGVSVACPADAFAPAGTPCGGNVCDGLGVCGVEPCGAPCSTGNPCELGRTDCSSGTPFCVGVGFAPRGSRCRASRAPCDPEETCSGSSITCPPDLDLCP